MKQKLFRQEVLLARQTDFAPAIELSPPKLGWIAGLCAFAIITLIFSVAFFCNYSRHETVEGTLVFSDGLPALTAPAMGIVTKTLVAEGEQVKAGQALLEISSELATSIIGNPRAEITNELLAKRDTLSRDLKDQEALASSQERELKNEIALLKRRISFLRERMALEQQRFQGQSKLDNQWTKAADRGIVSRAQLLVQHDQALASALRVEELNQQFNELHEQLGELIAERERLPVEVDTKRNETKRLLSDVMQALALNDIQRSILIRSPVDGVVTNLVAHTGESVQAEQPLVTVSRERAALLAELWTPNERIGLIAPGMPTVLHFHAYPYQRFGLYYGHVRSVGIASMSSSGLAKMPGGNLEKGKYRVLVELEKQSVLAYGKEMPLRPGMTLTAEIVTARRPIYEWFVEPLRAISREVLP